ncbi:MAG: M66 family metalloprotease [Actinobacteria bacterium]|nr:M66 family metalloprotease [Actinomycetota bacterium]
MKRFQATWLLFPVVVASAAVWSAPADAAMRAAPKGMNGVLRKLASNDGRFEASGNSVWAINNGSRLTPVDASVVVDRVSGSVLEFPTALGDEVSASSMSTAVEVRQPVKTTGVTASRTVTVIPLQWPGATWKTSDRTMANSIVSKLTPWWRAMSANQEALNIRFAAVLDVSSVNGIGQCDFYAMSDLAVAFAKEKGLYDTSNHLMMTFTGENEDCGFGGLGEVGGNLTWTYTAPGYEGIWAHELGHNMGLPHANACNAGVTLTYLKPCEEVEYGDVTGTMGMGGPSGFYAPTFLASVGWLPEANRAVWARTSATYSLNRPDRSDLGVTAINIPGLDGTLGDNSYWVQYNPNALTYVTDPNRAEHGGLVITFEPSKEFAEHRISLGGVLGSPTSTSYLCDLTPPTTLLTGIDYATDPRLLPLRSWTDPRNRFKITLASVDGTAASVQIEPLINSAVTAPATVSATPNPSGATSLLVSWQIAADAYGVNEPTTWNVDFGEDATKSCIALVWELSCTVSDISRTQTYTPGVSGTNGLSRSTRVTSTAELLGNSPPVFTASFTNTSDEIVAKIHVDSGGSPLIGNPTVEIEGSQSCTIEPEGDSTCTFFGLQRKTAHTLIAKGTNAIGTRETRFTARTLAGTPENPTISGKFVGSELVATVFADAADQNNVDVFEMYCIAQKGVKSVYGFGEGTSPNSKTFRLPKMKGKANYCYGRVMSTGTVKIYSSGYELLRIAANGKITSGKLVITPTISSNVAGIVNVKWKATDSLGKVQSVTAKSSTGSCKKTTATSCVIKGLTSGSVISIVLSGRGTSGSETVRSNIVVK